MASPTSRNRQLVDHFETLSQTREQRQMAENEARREAERQQLEDDLRRVPIPASVINDLATSHRQPEVPRRPIERTRRRSQREAERHN
jgi:hypothetical protein